MNGQIQYGRAQALTSETTDFVDTSIRLAHFRHELRSLGNAPSRANLLRMLEMAQEQQLPDDTIGEELSEIYAMLEGLDLTDQIARLGPPVVTSDRVLPKDECCHFVTPVRFGRRRSDQIGHLELTSGWLKFHGALDMSIVWAEVGDVERCGRDMVVSLGNGRRVLRFSCHAIRETVRAVVVCKYLVNEARVKDAHAINASQ